MQKKIDTVLLIDDDEITNFLNHLTIDRLHIAKQIDAVRNGEQAINYLKKRIQERKAPPSLIFLDINMPLMDGWQFITAYKKLKQELAYLPVIVMLSSTNNPDDHDRAEKIEEIAYFKQKPLTAEVIQELISLIPIRLNSLEDKV
ncbi:MAG: response regulator [Thalassobius sp.]|nr:response regulator [Thalassovita sp.]